jgi:hypothetical protein
MVTKFLFLLLTSILTITLVHAQEVNVSGGFLSDSIRIGEPVPFSVSVRYPQQINVLFPDSTYSFAPFEYASKKFFPTQTINGISHDSVVYYLTTFEIDKVQKLSLPVFVTTARDCTRYTSQPDSIYLVELVKNPPDSIAANNLPLKTSTLYEKVFSEINYVIALLIFIVLVFISIIVWLFFGKRIIRYFKSKKLLKKHNEFLERFAMNVNQLSSAFSREQAEHTLSLWKKYMEQLEKKPYTKLTTRETASMLPDGNLKSNLQLLDRAIYGHQTSVVEPLNNLQKVAEDHFTKIFESIKNG